MKIPATYRQVPFYGLYGEPLKNSDPGFIHIEDIADRSTDLGWVIKAHRHSKLFQVLCIFDGQLEVLLDDQKHQLEGNWAISIPPGVVHGFRFQPDSKGFVLSIDNSVLMETPETGGEGAALHELTAAPQLIDCPPDDEHFRAFLHYIECIRREFRQYQVKRNEAMAWLSKLALLSLNRQLWQKRVYSGAGSTDFSSLNQLWILLETHYRDHWPVSRYAENLHMSTSTLNRLCHAYIGESPKNIIQERVMGEAKRRLRYTRQSVEEIAYTLGFRDQAYFSRFFKKREGVTPGAYRQTVE